MNRQARQKGKYIMKKTFYKYTNKIPVSMQLNTKKSNKNSDSNVIMSQCIQVDNVPIGTLSTCRVKL